MGMKHMRFATLLSPSIEPQTEKEAKLKSFITDGFALREQMGLPIDSVTLIARNAASPVAQALYGALAERNKADIAVRAILMDTSTNEVTNVSLLDFMAVDFRLLRDPRFGSAHEQLVLAGDRVWIGDCMRRDPNKKDAFEMYHLSDAVKSAHAAISFERMWDAAKTAQCLAGGAVTTALFAAGQTAEAAITAPRLRR